ncbi:MAG TPA: hypothetical protein V6C97_20290 [Oculatellaceae cyanobacterium]
MAIFSQETFESLNISDLKEEPLKASLKSALREIEKLETLRELKLPENLFGRVPPKLVHVYKQRVATEPLRELCRHPDHIRYPLLAAFCHVRMQEINNSLTELLLQLIHKIDQNAETKVVQEFVSDLKRVHGKTNLLYRLAKAALNNPDGTVRDVIYPVVGEETLRDLLREFKASGRFYQQKVAQCASSSYDHYYQRIVPKVLNTLNFQSNNKQVMKALTILKKKEKLTPDDIKN